MLQVVNVQVVVAIEANQIMLVSLVVAEEQVLAMHRPVVLPPLLRLGNSLALGMMIDGIRNIVSVEKVENGFFACHRLIGLMGYFFVIFALVMRKSWIGRSCWSVVARSIFSTTSMPLTTRPKTV